MPEPDFSALEALRETPQPEPEVPRFEVHNYMAILAVDQSLANTGWVLFDAGDVARSGNIKTLPTTTGAEDILRRGEVLVGLFRKLLRELHPEYVVHELPPVSGGNRLVRLESSYVAAMALRAACAFELIPARGIQAQRVKKRLTGKGRGWTKADIRNAVLEHDPSLQYLKPRNEAIYDAIAIGWVAIEKGEEFWNGE